MSNAPDQKHDELARHAALGLLYARDLTDGEADQLLRDSYQTLVGLHPELMDCWGDVEARVRGVERQINTLNEEVQAVSPRWRLERMACIDRNILRLGAWEILESFRPPLRVINDCVELGKAYGEKGTPAFVNGLLDQLCQEHGISLKRKKR